MRVGILTLQYGANYGGTLQCYALYKTLTELGHKVEVINFKPTIIAPTYLRFIYNISMSRNWHDFVKTFSRITNNSLTKESNEHLVPIFDSFRNNHINLTESVNEYTISELNERFDAIVVGSDQVWSSMVRSHLTYFGEWVPEFTGKFISYAACAYTDKYPIVRRNKLRKLLNRFSAISVRDDLTKSLVNKFYNKNISLVADPTLLCNFEEFATDAIFKEPYIATYILGGDIPGGNEGAIDVIKQKTGIKKVVAITPYNKDIEYADDTYKNSTPQEWVNLIANSAFVYTDSFHGIIFSLKFKRNFIAYYKDVLRASRLIDLQHKYSLKNIVSNIDSIKDLSIDNTAIAECVSDEIHKLSIKSKLFLTDSL